MNISQETAETCSVMQRAPCSLFLRLTIKTHQINKPPGPYLYTGCCDRKGLLKLEEKESASVFAIQLSYFTMSILIPMLYIAAYIDNDAVNQDYGLKPR